MIVIMMMAFRRSKCITIKGLLLHDQIPPLPSLVPGEEKHHTRRWGLTLPHLQEVEIGLSYASSVLKSVRVLSRRLRTTSASSRKCYSLLGAAIMAILHQRLGKLNRFRACSAGISFSWSFVTLIESRMCLLFSMSVTYPANQM